jgi:hypothetical protein
VPEEMVREVFVKGVKEAEKRAKEGKAQKKI